MCASSVRKRLASMGTSVSDTKAEATMASETITANSWNSRPITPGMKKIGMNTATSDTLIASTVKPTSRAPRSAAARTGWLAGCGARAGMASRGARVSSSRAGLPASSVNRPSMRAAYGLSLLTTSANVARTMMAAKIHSDT